MTACTPLLIHVGAVIDFISLSTYLLITSNRTWILPNSILSEKKDCNYIRYLSYTGACDLIPPIFNILTDLFLLLYPLH